MRQTIAISINLFLQLTIACVALWIVIQADHDLTRAPAFYWYAWAFYFTFFYITMGISKTIYKIFDVDVRALKDNAARIGRFDGGDRLEAAKKLLFLLLVAGLADPISIQAGWTVVFVVGLYSRDGSAFPYNYAAALHVFAITSLGYIAAQFVIGVLRFAVKFRSPTPHRA